VIATRPFTRELETAIRCARLAGAAVLRCFGTDLEVERKAGREPVTAADRESERVILEGLRRDFPEDGFLGEEGADHSSWAGFPRSWVVDPLDGTKDFIARREGFCVMIGLLEDSRPVLGVVYQPVTRATYFAARGHGAWMTRDEVQIPLRVSAIEDPRALRLVVSCSHRSPFIDEAKQALGIDGELRLGSVGLKVGLVAQGERDLYLNPEGHCKLWDVCAPQIILEEAGGRMTDLRGAPMVYGPGALRVQGGVLASNGACHEAVLEALKALLPRGRGPR